MKFLKIALSAFIFVALPLQGFGLTVWVPRNFGEYIDFLDDTSGPYKIVYGHFISVGELDIEDTTDQTSEDFIANGYVSKWITAPAVFEIVDPRRSSQRSGPRRSEMIDVLLTANWNSAPDEVFNYYPEPDDYLEISFAHYAEGEGQNAIRVFEIETDGSYTYSGFDYLFHGPFSRARADELAGCVFDGECRKSEIRRLRSLRY